MPRKSNYHDPTGRNKQDRCRQYQNFLHHQKKDLIEQIAALILPDHMQHEETKVILREIRKVFEINFPSKIGQENGCLFRRTVEYGDVRKSIWATCDISKNFMMFQSKCQKGRKVNIKEEIDEDSRHQDYSATERKKHDFNVAPIPVYNSHSTPFTQEYLLSPNEQWNLLNAIPPRAKTPNPFQAVYPEQKTPFGISFNQQLEYQQAANDSAVYGTSSFSNPPQYPTGLWFPFQQMCSQSSKANVPMNQSFTNLSWNSSFSSAHSTSFDQSHHKFLTPFHFEHEETHGWQLAASPPTPPLTDAQRALFEFPKLWN